MGSLLVLFSASSARVPEGVQLQQYTCNTTAAQAFSLQAT
jgi:hypothetical protein